MIHFTSVPEVEVSESPYPNQRSLEYLLSVDAVASMAITLYLLFYALVLGEHVAWNERQVMDSRKGPTTTRYIGLER